MGLIFEVKPGEIFSLIGPNGAEKTVGIRGNRRVVVTLFNKAYCLIRFGTGDFPYYDDSPCPCGRTTAMKEALKLRDKVEFIPKGSSQRGRRPSRTERIAVEPGPEIGVQE